MIKDTSGAADDAIALIRAHIATLRTKQANGTIEPSELTWLLHATDRCVTRENNWAQALVAAIAGRRNLDKLPSDDVRRLLGALTGEE